MQKSANFSGGGQTDICLLDPNILASPNADDLLNQLKQTGAWIEFNQGLDARLLNNERINLIASLKIRRVHFAWDNADDQYTPRQLEKLSKHESFNKRNTVVYVLTNFNTTLEQDLMRIYKIREMGFYPYVMRYDKPNAPRVINRLARWVNNKWFFTACERFEDFRDDYT